MESLLERVKRVEKFIGLDLIDEDDGEPFSLQLGPLKHKLQQTGYGFVLSLPVDQLRRLREFYNEGPMLTTLEKLMHVELSAGLIQRQALLLGEMERTAELVLNSTEFEKAETLKPELNKTSEEVQRSKDLVEKFNGELIEFYRELLLCLDEVRQRIDKVECTIVAAEEERKGKA